MLKYVKMNILLIILCLSIFSFSTAKAQTPQEIIDGIQNNIEVSVTPSYPKAGDLVSIHLQSYSTPLNQATISWLVGGVVKSKGIAKTDFTITAGKVGSKTTVVAQVITANGSVVEKIITIQPADVDLLWQAISYVPPFYQGKALYPHQGLINFTAVPSISTNGNIAKSLGSYIYKWKKDGAVLGDFSGYGKNTFTMRGTIISRPFTIDVEVSSAEGENLGSASVTINPRKPEILFYENNPLLGVLYNQSLYDFTMQGKEMTISAVPFFYNTAYEPSVLEYKWTMNGQNIPSQSDPNTLTLRNASNLSGKSTIGLQVSNTLKALQFSSNSMNVSFGKTNETGL